MSPGSGPAGEITMDDIRQRLQSITARLTAMRERPAVPATGGGVDGQPGHVTPGNTPSESPQASGHLRGV